MKQRFSSNIETSLAGRNETASNDVPVRPAISKKSNEIASPISSEIEIIPSSEREADSNQGNSVRRSRAGRPKMSKDKKKTQLAITITPDAKSKLENWAQNKSRSATNYLSEYIEEHLDDIINYYDRK